MLTEPRAGTDAHPLALIADRDEDSRLLYIEFLQLHRWRVIGAAGGPEALAIALAERPDVVVSETWLPGFDGVVLSELLHRDRITAHIPIVFVTSDATAVNLAKAAASGASAVLTKPCLPDAVLRAVEAARTRSRVLTLRAAAAGGEARSRLARARSTLERAGQQRRVAHARRRALGRGTTIAPPIAPPALACPLCHERMRYLRSYLGGVSRHGPEQWDYFDCPSRCGMFEYRARTRKIRRVKKSW
jgi:CheY-like chemotaxis protein